MGSAGSSNLPQQMTSLVGRRGELDEVVDLLVKRDAPLLTLTGSPGVGKTRLALSAAEMAARHFNDGVCFVDLAPLADPALVPTAIAQALGLTPAADRPILDALKEHLEDQDLLLMLDNFEHLLEGATLVPQLIVACPELQVLATSRQKLNIRGERVFQVQPLSLPKVDGEVTADQACSSDAVRLFVDRARAVLSDLILTDENADDIVAICSHLDGLPLAIELAAARSDFLAPKAMRARLEKAQSVPGGGGGDRPARQQTIWNAVAWSFYLLTAEEQTLFRRLSVFVRGCSQEAAEAVAGGERGDDVFAGLSSLQEKCLLQCESGPDGESRFSMLQTLRQFGVEQLRECGEEESVRWAHAGYFLQMVERAEPDIIGARRAKWIAQLDFEYADVQSALQWCLSCGETGGETALRICKAIWWFWKGWGAHSDASIWLRRAIDVGAEANPQLLARALLFLGHSLVQRDLEEARSCYQRSLTLCRQCGDKRGEAWALCGLGMVANPLGEFDEANRFLREGQSAFAEIGDAYGVALATHHLGSVAAKRGDLNEAFRLSSEALKQWLEDKQVANAVFALTDLARLYRMRHEADHALALLTRAGNLNQSLGSRETEGYIVFERGQVALLQGNHQEAIGHFVKALTLFRRAGLRDYYTAAAIESIARIALLQDQIADGVGLLAAMDNWRRMTRIKITAADDLTIKRDLDVAERKLGRELVKTQWLIGQTTSLDDAIAVAFSITVKPIDDDTIREEHLPDDLRRLSPREREILCLVARGLKDREVARELGIGTRSVSTMMTRVFQKLPEHDNRMKAANYAAKHGLCDLPQDHR